MEKLEDEKFKIEDLLQRQDIMNYFEDNYIPSGFKLPDFDEVLYNLSYLF